MDMQHYMSDSGWQKNSFILSKIICTYMYTNIFVLYLYVF